MISTNIKTVKGSYSYGRLPTYPAVVETPINQLQTKLNELQYALNQSNASQKQLQDAVSFLLQKQSQLRSALEISNNRVKSLEQQLSRVHSELTQQRQNSAELKELLVDSNHAIAKFKADLEENENQITRLQNNLREQKRIIDSLESERISKHYNNVLGLSTIENKTSRESADTIDKADLYEMQERYEKRINELECMLKKKQRSLGNEQARIQSLELEIGGFRGWLCKVMGIDRVVPGCDKLLMKEIQKRLNGLM